MSKDETNKEVPPRSMKRRKPEQISSFEPSQRILVVLVLAAGFSLGIFLLVVFFGI